jgi:DNA polymerase-3 subunit alpha
MSSACEGCARGCSRPIESAMEHGSRTQRDKDLGQADLFGGGESGGAVVVALPDVPAWSEIDQLNFEKESLGLYWSGHPVDRYAADLAALGAKTTTDLLPKREAAEVVADETEEALAGAPGVNQARTAAAAAPPEKRAEDIAIGGIVGGLRPLKTRKGDRMCVFVLDDPNGSIEVVVFPEAFKQFGHLAEAGRLLLVKGRSNATTSPRASWPPK